MPEDGPLLRLLLKAWDETGPEQDADIFLRDNLGSLYARVNLILDDIAFDVNMPNEHDPASIERGLRISPGRYVVIGGDNVDAYVKLCEASRNLIIEFNSQISDLAEEARERKRLEAEEAERKADERAAEIERRKDMLLNEMLGEKGRIRTYGSRTYQPIVVTAIPAGMVDDYFEVHFEWINQHDQGRERRLERVRIFDIKIGSRYKEVWNDGTDDLNPYDEPLKRRVAKYDGEFRV